MKEYAEGECSKIYERQNASAFFECLLTKNNEIAIHTKNLQKLLTEVYKSLNQGSTSFMEEFFVQRELDISTLKQATISMCLNYLKFLGVFLVVQKLSQILGCLVLGSLWTVYLWRENTH